MITIVKYGMGNVGSVLNMYRKLGIKARCETTPEGILGSSHLILPGIGAFDACVAALAASGLREAVLETARRGKPLLGICVGMQMLGESSEEGPGQGLNLIRARSHRIVVNDADYKVPHMGWNEVSWTRNSALVGELRQESRFYFVHSFQVKCDDEANVLAVTQHERQITAAISAGNVFGVQFHPEKSHRFGLELLRNFATL